MQPRREAAPEGAARKCSTPIKPPASILPQPPPTRADLAAPLVELIAELRSDIPLPIIATLVVAALDKAADTALDEAWARQRAAAWPDGVALAHNKHVGTSYAQRRAGESEAAKPRPGDHPGGPVSWLRSV